MNSLFIERFRTAIYCCPTLNPYIKPPHPSTPLRPVLTTNTATFSISSSLCADYSSSPRHQD